MGIQQMYLGGTNKLIPVGQSLWNGISTQSASWTVPTDVTAISAVAVGGGGNGSQGYVSTHTHGGTGGNGGNLAYSNDIAVTPGESLTIVIAPQTAAQSGSAQSDGNDGGESGIKRGSTWLLKAVGGKGGARTRLNASWNILNDSGSVGDVVRSGGLGGCRRAPTSGENFCGGGGAAGYSGGGGDGGVYVGYGSTSSYALSGSAGSGGGGSGGVAHNNGAGAGGGGVGLLGEGSSGAAVPIYDPSDSQYWSYTDRNSTRGNPGSGGTIGSVASNGDDGGNGGHYGGGAGGQKTQNRDDWGRGGAGGVRIIHGTGRAYPSTRTADE